MSIQEMAVENAEKRLKEIDKLDFAISAWADYDNGLTQGFKDGAETMLEEACEWLRNNIDLYVETKYDEDFRVDIEQLLNDIRKAMEE